MTMTSKLRIAVQGCCHGELDLIFQKVNRIHRKTPIDLLIILGDFQSLRDTADFASLSVPAKYQRWGDFRKYYWKDTSQSPTYLTLVIGGNHESMRHLMQLPHGGYLAPNIYYIGFSGVFWYRGVRIGGLSGIYNDSDYKHGYSRPSWKYIETHGLWRRHVRNLYHITQEDVDPLMALKTPVDVMASHDWPQYAADYGDTEQLLRCKPYFKVDMETKRLGNPLAWNILQHNKPHWWLSAHLHVYHEAIIPHQVNIDEITLEPPSETHFIGLDKCLPHRKHLTVIEVDTHQNHVSSNDRNTLYYDQEFIESLTSAKNLSDDQLAVPSYTQNIHRKEEEQTRIFKSTFGIE